ncbi:MAG TPA: InlB B-repeat-containing protein [Clostridiales bacterium]|nr:InlB B-repeat-containing protein [Clostridiales bacterium]
MPNKRFFWLFLFLAIIWVLGCSSQSGVKVYFHNQEKYAIVKKDQSLDLPEPQKEGYDFEGWYFDCNFQNRCDEDDLKNLKQDVTLYPKWTPKKYTINLYDGSSEPIGATAEYNSPVLLRSFCYLEGFKLIGYSESQDVDILYEDGFLMPARDLDLYVQKSPIKVSFETFCDDVFDSLDFNDLKQTKDLPIPSKIGHKFDGWFLDKDFEKEFDIESYSPQDDFKLFAKWAHITKIEAINTKTEYIEGQSLDFGSVAIKILYNNGDFETIGLSPQHLREYDMNRLGRQELKVYFRDWKTSFEIEIRAKTLTHIEAVSYQKEYQYMEELNTQVELLLYYDNDTTEKIYLEDARIDGYDKSFVGNQILTILYNHNGEVKACDIDVIVLDSSKIVSKIELICYPKTEYYLGEELDVSGGAIKVKYRYDEFYPEELIALTKDMVSGFDSSVENDNLELVINYEDMTCYYRVKIINVFEFEETNEGYIIKGLKNDCYQTKIIIPAEYKGKPIIKISSLAFMTLQIPIAELVINPRTCELYFDMWVFGYYFFDCYVYCDVQYINWGNLYLYAPYITFYSDNSDTLDYLARNFFNAAY